MNGPWKLILVVAAFLLCLFAGVTWWAPAEPWRNRLIGLGLACYFLSLLITG